MEQYTIDAEISPNTQSLAAKATVRFVPVDDGVTSASFELNNALNVSKVVDDTGKQIPASRTQQDFTVRLTFDQPLPKGQPVNITFFYDGKLTGKEDSPVYGIKFAAIHPDFAYLMYPARWFPVSGYTTDRFGADMRVTVPDGLLGAGQRHRHAAGDRRQEAVQIRMEKHSFPGSIAVVKDQGAKVQSEGVDDDACTSAAPRPRWRSRTGQEIGKIMSYFTGIYGIPPYANLTVVETESGAPNGYAAPGHGLPGARGIGRQPNGAAAGEPGGAPVVGGDALADHAQSPVARKRAGGLLGTAVDGAHGGRGRAGDAMRAEMVGALTMDNVPMLQSARLEDFSPELWALTGSKGAAAMHMLRFIVGDEKFFQILKTFAQQNVWKSVSTDDFKKVAETISGQDLGYFFIQWVGIERRAGVPAGIHDLPHAEGLPRDGQDLAGPGHVPHAGGPADRDRRQSRGEADRGGGDRVGVLRGHVRQAEEDRDRPEQPGAAVQQRHPRGGGDPQGRAVRGVERVRRRAEGVSEGARDRRATARWRITGSPKWSSCRTCSSRRRTISARR